MADEILTRDQNHITVIGAVTDDANQEIRMARIDDATKALKVTANFPGNTDGQIKVTAADTTFGYLYGTKLTAGPNVTLTVLNPGGNESVEISAAGASGYNTIQEDGVDLTQRTKLNFVTGLIATDDGGGARTNVDVDIPYLESQIDLANLQGLLDLSTQTTGFLTLPTQITGVLDAIHGGTDQNAVAQGDLLFGVGVNLWDRLAKDTNATRYLSNRGASNNPSWSLINLENGVENTLNEVNGGTNQSTYAQGDMLYATAIDTLGRLAKDTNVMRVLCNTGINNAPKWDLVDFATGTTGLVDLATRVTGILPLINGGTGSALSDPGADRIMFWDDSASQVTWLQAGTGLIITGTVMTVAANTYIMTAQEDITIGDRVGVSLFRQNKVSKAFRLKYTNTSGSQPALDLALGTGGVHRCPIGGNKVAACWNDGGGILTAFVTTFDTSNFTNTVGATSTVTSSLYTLGSFHTQFCIVKLGTDKFAIFYTLTGTNTSVNVAVGVVSGNTITFTTTTGIIVGPTAQACLDAEYISDDKIVLSYGISGGGFNTRVITFSGTTPTVGAAVALSANTGGTGYRRMIRKIATDKFVIMNITNTYAQVGSISGTTITLGTEVQATATAQSSPNSIVELVSHTTDAFVMKAAGIGYRAATVSGTAISYGTAATGTATTYGHLRAVDSSTVYGYLDDTPSGFVTVDKIDIIGNAITVTSGYGQNFKAINTAAFGYIGSLVASRSSARDWKGFFTLDGGLAITFYSFRNAASWTGESGATVASNSIIQYYWIEGMSNNFIGTAQQTVSSGAIMYVLTDGTDENQSGLVPGHYYYVGANGVLGKATISATSVALTDVYTLMPKFLALSPTQAKLM